MFTQLAIFNTIRFILVAGSNMREETTAVCCQLTYDPQLYFEIPWKIIFANDFIRSLTRVNSLNYDKVSYSIQLKISSELSEWALRHGTDVMTQADTVSSWFL